MIEYVHLPEDEEIGPLGGSYRIKEELLDYKGSDVLYIRSESSRNITVCRGCSLQGVISIFIKGRIIEWKAKNEREEVISKLEEITNLKEQQEIKEIIKAKYKQSSISF